MPKAKLIEMGQVATIDLDGTKNEYPMALVIEFDSPEAIRKAIADGECEFTFGADAGAQLEAQDDFDQAMNDLRP